MSAPLVVPVPSNFDREYWEACRQEKLVAQRCSGCRRLRFFPSLGCPHCGSDRASWEQLSGRGTVYSWIIVHPPVLPAFADKVPYNVAVIELAEGIRMVSSLVGCRNEEIRIGMPVAVTFEKLTDEITLPKFRPA
jgi:uncharacterized OB-fold protein